MICSISEAVFVCILSIDLDKHINSTLLIY
uniref:Uncharacterized protein n=1 Tax=Arundo donax TaxID=35708 RepID=A0A0A9H6X8_ARUDO